jgi:hypothetical protein
LEFDRGAWGWGAPRKGGIICQNALSLSQQKMCRRDALALHGTGPKSVQISAIMG